MNVEKIGKLTALWRTIRSPYMKAVFFLRRAKIVLDFVVAFRNAKDYELRLQTVRQSYNDLMALGKENEAYKALGYANAIEDMLNGR